MHIGQDRLELDTPALWVDLDHMEANIAALAAFFAQAGVDWRPHTKGIKVPAIAHKMLRAGAIGITCAKLSEAEVMAAAGIQDLLVANQVVGPQKIARLVKLRHSADVIVAVDSYGNASAISEAAVAEGVRIRVLIEVDSGMQRVGLAPGQSSLDFARQIAGLPGIDVAGVMAWEGHCAGITDMDAKTRCVQAAVGSLVGTAELLRSDGIEARMVSCGGSGTYMVTAGIPGVTEIQAGGAVFSDVAYQSWLVPLDPALFVLATVTSRPTSTRAIVDAGRKAMNGEVAMPRPKDMAGVRLAGLNAEHGILEVLDGAAPLEVGDKLDFVVGYGDNTVYLHDVLYGVRGGCVECAWPILARGRLT